MKVPVCPLNLADLARPASRFSWPRLLPALFAGLLLLIASPAVAALSLGRGTPTTVGCIRFASSPDSVTITGALTAPGTITGGLAIPANRIQYDIINCDAGNMYSWTVYFSPIVGPDIIGAATPNGYVDLTGVIVPQGGYAYTTLFNAGFGVYNYNTGAHWLIDYEPDHITFSTTASPPGLPPNAGVGYLNPTPYLPSFAILFNPDLANGLVPASAMLGGASMNGQVYGPLPGNPCLSIACSNIVVETCSNCVPVTFSATALDPCCTNANLIYQPQSGTCFSVNTTTTVTAIAYDSCGNIVTNFFTVTVNPGPNCPPTNCITIYSSNIVAHTCAPCTPVAYNTFAVDNCCPGAPPTLIFNPPPGTCFPQNSSNTVHVIAYDQCGHTNTGTFTVTVLPGPDCGNTNCISIIASNIVEYACSSCAMVPFNVSVSDQCCTSGGLTVSYNPPTNTCFPLNSTTAVQIQASDACGNTATKFITVTVLPGPNCIPTNCITLYSSNIVVYTCSNCTSVSYPVSVLDTCCSAGATLSFNPPETYCFPLNSTNTVNVNAADQCGNTANGSFTVTVLPGPGCANMLPVYHVDQFGATAAQAALMASAFNIPTPPQTDARGVVHYLDYTNYLTVPSSSVTDTGAISLLQGQTVNESPSIPLQFQQVNFSALSNLTVFNPNAALLLTSNALASAGLIPQNGTPTVAQPIFTTFYITNPFPWVPTSNSVPLDTEVNYQLSAPNGYPLEGSGAQAQFAFGSGGNVTRLLYAVPHLSPGAMVQIIPMPLALSRAGALMDPTHSLGNLNLTGSIAYRCVLCPPPCVEGPIFVLPYVKVTGSVLQTNKLTGEVSTLHLTPQYILATDDPAFSPQATLSASTVGSGNQIQASVRVSGGIPPYTYTWAGSSPDVVSNTGTGVGYDPIYRATPPPLLTTYVQALHKILIHWWTTGPYPTPWVLESSSDLSQGPAGWTSVTNDVQTSNGVSTVELDATAPRQFFRLRLASQTVPITEILSVQVTDANGSTVQTVTNVPVLATVQAAIPARAANVIDWGTESPYDPGLGTGDRDGWRVGMTAGSAGVERFLWTGTSSWKEDFIDAPAGIDDYEVDNADITLYIGHGNPVVFTFTGGPGPNPTTLFYNDATHSWGGWDAEWLCLLSCEVLQYDWNGLKTWQRWGPNFDGLHTLLGFSSLAYAGTGFPDTFASAMLGNWGTSPVSIVSAWFNAAHECGTGTPAAMGPIGPGSAYDYGDYFWGRGPVGPTIRNSQILGWWYISY